MAYPGVALPVPWTNSHEVRPYIVDHLLRYRRILRHYHLIISGIIHLRLEMRIGLLFLISNFLRLGAGFVAPRRVLDLRLTRLWIDYTLVTGVIAMGLVLALPALVTMLGARP